MSDAKLVLCGGGSLLSWSGVFARAAIGLTKKQLPHMLVVPTAKTHSGTYNIVLSTIGTAPGFSDLPFSVLHDYDERPTVQKSRDLIAQADLLYVPGGDASRLVGLFASEVGKLLIKAVQNGELVVLGIAEGILPWFTKAYDDKYGAGTFALMPANGPLPAIGCALYDSNHLATTVPRRNNFWRALREAHIAGQRTIGIGISSNAALQVSDGNATVLTDGKVQGRAIERVITEGDVRQRNIELYNHGTSMSLEQLLG